MASRKQQFLSDYIDAVHNVSNKTKTVSISAGS